MIAVAVEQLSSLKPQHIFDLMSTLEVIECDEIVNLIVEPWFKEQLHSLMPEEVVITAKILGKLNGSNHHKSLVHSLNLSLQSDYILHFLNEGSLSFLEVAKLYSAMKQQLPVSPEFDSAVFTNYLVVRAFEKQGKSVPAESLGYLLPLLCADGFKDFPLESVQTLILNVFGQQNFSSSTYVVAIGQLLEHIQKADGLIEAPKQKLIRRNLEFWREVVGYLDRVDFKSVPELKQMQLSLIELDDSLPELDFSAAIEYLDYL